MGDFSRAVADLNAVIRDGSGELRDYFLRGWWNLENGNALAALEDLTTVINLGTAQDFHYFTETAYFFRALGLLQLSRFDEALADCELVHGEHLMYLQSTGKITRSQILEAAQTAKTKEQK